ncbi:MAG: twin-arginine translocase subunit TatC [Acidimicrobiales bacterium]|nr:twin-arginine translocase subunit TatC [Acidimicrobiales bacterium]
MSFWDHLAELRRRLIYCVVALTVTSFFGVLVYDWLLENVFLPPYCRVLIQQGFDRPCNLVILDPLDGFRTRIKVSIYVGLVLAMPILLWNLWRFVTPALQRREKRLTLPFIISGLTLFGLGAYLAYNTFERALSFLISFGGSQVDPMFSPGSYLGLITYMMFAFGIGFQFPILLVFLQLVGILRPQQLRKARRFCIVGIVAAAAIITPSGDPISLATLAIPLCVFFELSILIGYVSTRRKHGWVPRSKRGDSDEI